MRCIEVIYHRARFIAVPFRLAMLAVLFVALQAAQVPRWGFEFVADSCCCDHAGKCPCPGHALPKHEKSDSVRACGSGGHDVTQPAAPVLELHPPAMTFVAAIAAPHQAPPLSSPRAQPDLDEPAAPS
jgi:hypothetical protein